jgi:hypothetical protein
MCSGFFVGSIQYINFITASAFLPVLVQSLLQLVYSPNWKHSAKFALGCYFIFSSGHPAIPFATVYFLIFLLTCLLLFERKNKELNYKGISLHFMISAAMFAFAALPAAYSYISIAAFYGRGGSPLVDTGFNPASYISFILPFSTTAVRQTFFTNDVAMRNGYFSLLGLAGLFVSLRQRNKMSLILMMTGIAMLVLSLGDGLKESLYGHLPLLKYVRTNGEFRVFSILCFCVAAGLGLSDSTKHPTFFLKLKKFNRIILIATLVSIAGLLVFEWNDVKNFLMEVFHQPQLADKIRHFLSRLSISGSVLVSLIIVFCFSFAALLRKNISLRFSSYARARRSCN